MAKTEYEKELGKLPYSTLVYMCESRRVLHTGDENALIARLVEAETEAEGEAEGEAETEAEGEAETEGEGQPKCAVCGLLCKSEAGLKSHMRTHAAEPGEPEASESTE